MPGSSSDREITHTRLISAPRELVFRAFSESEHLARFWGPKGFRTTIREFDFRPGSSWRLTMHGPDGTAYENVYVLLEAIEPERIVISHPDPEHEFQLTITLAEEGVAAEVGDQRSEVRTERPEKTRLTWRMRFESAEHCHEVKPFVIEANQQNLDRLEAELATMI